MNMKKRVFSLLLCLLLLIGMLPTTAMAGATDTWAVKLNVYESDKYTYNGQKVLALGFGVQSDNLKLKAAQVLVFEVDLTVLEFLQWNNTDKKPEVYIPPVLSLTQNTAARRLIQGAVIDEDSNSYWSARLYQGQSADGKTGYMMIQASQDADNFDVTTPTDIATAYIGFKAGKTVSDLASNSIRFFRGVRGADGSLVNDLAQTAAVTVTDGDKNNQHAIFIDGKPDEIAVPPEIVWNGIELAKPALTGAITIKGTPKIDEALTVDVSGLPSDAGALTYKWLRDGAEVGTSDSYTPTAAEDVGKTIKVEVSAANYNGSVSAVSAAVALGDGPVAPGDLASVATTDTTITVTENSAWEYSINGGAYQDSNEFTGLTANTAYSIAARVKATATHNASAPCSAISVTTAKGSADAETQAKLKDSRKPYSGAYNGAAHGAFMEYAMPAGWTVKYSTDGINYSDTNPQVTHVADSKTMHVMFEHNDYAAVKFSYDITVTPKDVTVSGISATPRQYADNNKEVELNGGAVDGKVGSDDVTVDLSSAKGTMADANAGPAKTVTITGVKLGGTAKGDYNLKEQPADITVSISQALTPDAPTGLEGLKGKLLSTVDLPDGWSWADGATVMGTEGSQSFPAKYHDDNGNYADGTKDITILVKDKTDVSGEISFSDGTLEYNGSGQTYEGATIGITPVGTASWTYTYAISGSGMLDSSGHPKTVGTYLVTAIYEDDANHGQETATLTITPKKIDVPVADTTAFTYNGSSQTYNIPASADYTVSGNSQMNANEAGYTVTVALTDTANTVWKDDNSTADKTYTFIIKKATPTGTPEYTKITKSGQTLADANLTMGSITPTGGTLVWNDGDAQTVAANTEYNWTYTPAPADSANWNKLTGSIKPYIASSSGGGGGGSSIDPKYSISVKSGKNGSVSVSPESARKGDTVTVTVKPNEGYELDTLKILDQKGSKVKFTEKNGKYTFVMPGSKVTVEATFVEKAAEPFFKDVSTKAYYYEAVKWAADKGITGGIGDNLFGPNQPCTRAQIVTFLHRAAGSPAAKSMSNFTDVPASAYYANAVAWAVENGITGGTGDGLFSPNATCTRAQAVTFLHRATGNSAVSGGAQFRDVASNAYYANAVAWASKNGVTDGIGNGLFGSDNDCTRAQIVTFLFRTFGGK